VPAEFKRLKPYRGKPFRNQALASYRHKKTTGSGAVREVYMKIEPWCMMILLVKKEFTYWNRTKLNCRGCGSWYFNNCIVRVIDARFISVKKGDEKMAQGPPRPRLYDVRVYMMHPVDTTSLKLLSVWWGFAEPLFQAGSQLLEPIAGWSLNPLSSWEMLYDRNCRYRSVILSMESDKNNQVYQGTPRRVRWGLIKLCEQGSGQVLKPILIINSVPADGKSVNMKNITAEMQKRAELGFQASCD